MINTNNVEIRQAKGYIPWWKIAEKVGIAEVTLVKWLRVELDPMKKERVMGAIMELKKEMM